MEVIRAVYENNDIPHVIGDLAVHLVCRMVAFKKADMYESCMNQFSR